MSVSKILRSKKANAFNPIGDLMEKVSAITANRSLSDGQITKLALSNESLDGTQEQLITTVFNSIETNLKSTAQDFNIAAESYQLEAASIAGVMCADPKLFMSTGLKKFSSMEGFTSAGYSAVDGILENPLSMEAYDERDNRNAQVFSIVYNLLASRQDDFAEMFFPTIVINPNEVGITLTVKIFYAFNDFKRSVTGALANFGRKNIIRAYTDATILLNEQTRAIPVLRATGAADDNSAVFVPAATLAPTSVTNGTSVFTTSAISVGKKVDLIGLSETQELLANGLADVTDTLTAYIKLEKIYVRFTSGTNVDIVEFDVSELPGSTFTYSPQGNYRKMILTLDSESLVVKPTTTKVDGAPLLALSEFAANNWNGLLRATISGHSIIDKGETLVNPGTLELVAARDSLNNLVPFTAPAYVSAAATCSTAEVIGYKLEAYRANTNLRQRGQLIDSQLENQSVAVMYRSPISTLAPAANNTVDDSSALQTLITTTGIRVSNEAVTALLKAQVSLASYTPVANISGDVPEVFGIGRYYVKPTYFTEAINLPLTVDSQKSHERAKDIKAAIVEKLRYYASEMYRSSEYKPAAMVLTGNVGFKPTVIIGTDPVIYNYIMVDGDLRTLGDQFDVKVVCTTDSRVSGKIFMSFGAFDGARNTTVNPLNFGNMLWGPEVTTTLPISRNGQVSKELTVAPRFLHLVNLPLLTVLDITGIPATVGKVQTNYHVI